jgi:hypothetical protein
MIERVLQKQGGQQDAERGNRAGVKISEQKLRK